MDTLHLQVQTSEIKGCSPLPDVQINQVLKYSAGFTATTPDAAASDASYSNASASDTSKTHSRG